MTKSIKRLNMDTGEIHIITGPMYSGKTSEIQKIINKYKILDVQQIIFNHSIDTRYGEGKIYSHDKHGIDCIQTDTLLSFIDNDLYKESTIVIIDEAHFFTDLREFVLDSCYKYYKRVYVAGLNGDFERKQIGDILSLVSECDTITKLSALCTICKDGTPAIFSKRITESTDTILVGSDKDYISVCRKHHL